MLDLICLSTYRPVLLQKTIDSFLHFLFKKQSTKIRLILHIDNIGYKNIIEKNKQKKEILSYVSKLPFCSINLLFNEGSPSFNTSLRSCLHEAKTPYIFYLEDDWELKVDLDLQSMIYLMEQDQDLVHLRLSEYDSKLCSKSGYHKLGNTEFTSVWNFDYFEIKEKIKYGWGNAPSLNRKELFSCLNNFKPLKTQLGEKISQNNFKSGFFHLKETEKAVIDLGSKWKKENSFVKAKTRGIFDTWERKRNADLSHF